MNFYGYIRFKDVPLSVLPKWQVFVPQKPQAMWGLQHTNIHAWNQLQKHSTCWWNGTFSCVLYLFCWRPHVWIWIWISCVLPHTLSDQSDHLYAYECTAVTEHAHHHLHKKMLLPPAWCHWLRVTGGCLCHPSEPVTASSPACHSCCLSGQRGRQQVHSLRDSIIHQGGHLKLGPACLHSLRPSHARLTHTEV